MKKLLPLAILYCITISAAAQTNTNSFVITTNLVEAHPFFRRVNGQLYNTYLSSRWQLETFSFISQSNGLVFANKVNYEPIYEVIKSKPLARPDSLVSSGNFIGSSPGQITGSSYGSSSRKVEVGKNRILGARVAITNLTEKYALDEEFSVRTLVTGKVPVGENLFELHDVGTVNVVEVIKTNSITVK